MFLYALRRWKNNKECNSKDDTALTPSKQLNETLKIWRKLCVYKWPHDCEESAQLNTSVVNLEIALCLLSLAHEPVISTEKYDCIREEEK